MPDSSRSLRQAQRRSSEMGALEPSVPAEEVEAVRRCQRGEADAFRLIVDRYGDLLHGTAYLMTRDRTVAEDAAQEALTAGWRGIGTFDAERPLRPWLLRILVNQVLQRRRRKWLRLIPLPDADASMPSDEPGPEHETLRAWERDEVRDALRVLKPDATRVIVLRYFADLTVPEIADALGVPEGTVKSRLHRALRVLQQEFASRRIGEGAEEGME